MNLSLAISSCLRSSRRSSSLPSGGARRRRGPGMLRPAVIEADEAPELAAGEDRDKDERPDGLGLEDAPEAGLELRDDRRERLSRRERFEDPGDLVEGHPMKLGVVDFRRHPGPRPFLDLARERAAGAGFDRILEDVNPVGAGHVAEDLENIVHGLFEVGLDDERVGDPGHAAEKVVALDEVLLRPLQAADIVEDHLPAVHPAPAVPDGRHPDVEDQPVAARAQSYLDVARPRLGQERRETLPLRSKRKRRTSIKRQLPSQTLEKQLLNADTRRAPTLASIRLGAQPVLQKAAELELTEFLGWYHCRRSRDGLLRGYRNGYVDEQNQTGEGSPASEDPPSPRHPRSLRERSMNERLGLSLIFAGLVDASARWRGVTITPAVRNQLEELRMNSEGMGAAPVAAERVIGLRVAFRCERRRSQTDGGATILLPRLCLPVFSDGQRRISTASVPERLTSCSQPPERGRPGRRIDMAGRDNGRLDRVASLADVIRRRDEPHPRPGVRHLLPVCHHRRRIMTTRRTSQALAVAGAIARTANANGRSNGSRRHAGSLLSLLMLLVLALPAAVQAEFATSSATVKSPSRNTPAPAAR